MNLEYINKAVFVFREKIKTGSNIRNEDLEKIQNLLSVEIPSEIFNLFLKENIVGLEACYHFQLKLDKLHSLINKNQKSIHF